MSTVAEPTETQEKYADRIAKLLRKAESTTPEEAEALFEKAQELMTKYAIDQAMIDASQGVVTDVIVKEAFTHKGTYREATSRISGVVSKANGCRNVYYDDTYSRVYTLYIIGFKSDVDRSKLLDSSLQIQCAKALNAWWKEFDGAKWMDRNRKFAARREFIWGFAAGVRIKLEAANARAKSAAEETEAERSGSTSQEASDSVALVLRSRKERVDEWMDKEYGSSLRTVSRSYKGGGMSARAAGQSAGQAADVGQPGLKSRRTIGPAS